MPANLWKMGGEMNRRNFAYMLAAFAAAPKLAATPKIGLGPAPPTELLVVSSAGCRGSFVYIVSGWDAFGNKVEHEYKTKDLGEPVTLPRGFRLNVVSVMTEPRCSEITIDI